MSVVSGSKRAHEQDDGCEADTECEEPPKKRARIISNNLNKNGENESTMENLTISKCGNNTFIKPFSDSFLEIAQESGADLHVFHQLLKEKHIFIGSPQNHIHDCANHLRQQMEINKVTGVVATIVNNLIESGNLKGAATSLQATLKYSRDNPK